MIHLIRLGVLIMKKILLLGVLLLVLSLGKTVSAATGVVNGEGLDWEMSILPKPTLEEIEKERWQPILENDIGIYTYANDSIVKEHKLVSVLVKTVFTNKEVLERLNKQYASKLAGEDIITYCQLTIKFDVAKKMYLVEKTEIFTGQNNLIASKEVVGNNRQFATVPKNSFAEAMLAILLK